MPALPRRITERKLGKNVGAGERERTILGETSARGTVEETSRVGEAGMKWIFLCVVVVMGQAFLQEAPKPAEDKPAATEAKPAADAAKLVNPTKPTAASLALGKKAYGSDCEMCHGKTGAGDGDLAVDMKLKLKDYRDPDALKSMTDGEIFIIIEKGKGQMSGEEGRMQKRQIWDVVNYVRSLGKKA
jgi:mono/diheme cytochrome c family protein